MRTTRNASRQRGGRGWSVGEAQCEMAKTTLRVNIGEALMREGAAYAGAAAKASEIVDYFFAQTLPHVLTALTRERDTLEAQLAGSRAANADLRDERDEARAALPGAFTRSDYETRLRVDRDALLMVIAERDAAIARAEKAERERDFEYADRIVAEAEAARLREALHDVSAACDTGTLSDQLAANVRRIRAALAPAAEAPPTKRWPQDYKACEHGFLLNCPACPAAEITAEKPEGL